MISDMEDMNDRSDMNDMNDRSDMNDGAVTRNHPELGVSRDIGSRV
jgi:hypothetical protein